ncbi:uncharacterized protein LOC128268602 isoform X2 [Anopheles cruzii]|uniref:uncharacterized protein LOC128268602 isoform X2 n=1 Tax=Anopheles cruzii TaxID=68878 RepID=UPI0022EC1B1F|nr:uncharacterized protein LOC128268602 isoform X2 [Anopheles cruzii]
MTTGYKHLYSCLTFLIFVFVFNFYKNRIHLSRERETSYRAASKMKRTGVLNKPLPLDMDGEDFFFGLQVDPANGDLRPTLAKGWEEHSSPHPTRCLMAEIFFATPTAQRSRLGSVVDPEGLHYKTSNERSRRKDPLHDHSSVPNSSVYVFLSVLVILLVAACVDIAKHLTSSARSPGDTKRRLSLQNYQSLIREKQKQFRMMKQHCSQPSMSIQRSIDEPLPPSALSYGLGRKDDSRTGSAAPLLRRQSVPTLMRTQPSATSWNGPSPLATGASFGRRTSVDSFWDVDSSGPPSLGSSPEDKDKEI